MQDTVWLCSCPPLPCASGEIPACKGGFPDSSVGKESTFNAGDPNLILGLGRSAGEGISYPLQHSWASLVAQLVKNPPATLETWVRSLGWEDPLEKGKATHSSILAWRIPWTIQSMGSQSQTRLSDFHFTQYLYGIDWFQDLQDTKICGFSYFIKNGTVFVDNLHICSHRL